MLFQNARDAIRVLARSPGFALTVIVTLAVAIGANGAVFSAIDTVLLRPLPFPEADRLAYISHVQETTSAKSPFHRSGSSTGPSETPLSRRSPRTTRRTSPTPRVIGRKTFEGRRPLPVSSSCGASSPRLDAASPTTSIASVPTS